MQKPYFTSAIKALAIALCFMYFPLSLADTLHGRVVSVADGDTVTVLDNDNQQYKIRIMGIDAPEKRQAFGDRSKQHLSQLVFGKPVAVEWNKHDRYGRIVGKVLVSSAVNCTAPCPPTLDTGLAQISQGLAWHYKKYANDQSPEDRQPYADAEIEARQSKLGLWGDADPVSPWEFRHR